MRTVDEVQKEIMTLDAQVDQYEKNIEYLQKKRQQLMSEGFKLKYGVAFGETFKYAGKDYILVDQNNIKQVGAKYNRRAEGIRDFFKGESDSPFQRKPIQWDGPLKLE